LLVLYEANTFINLVTFRTQFFPSPPNVILFAAKSFLTGSLLGLVLGHHVPQLAPQRCQFLLQQSDIGWSLRLFRSLADSK
jgi:hypothetical protein